MGFCAQVRVERGVRQVWGKGGRAPTCTELVCDADGTGGVFIRWPDVFFGTPREQIRH